MTAKTDCVSIRELRAADEAWLPPMIANLDYDPPANLGERIADVVARSDAVGLVAELDGRPVGYAVAIRRVSLTSPRPTVWLEELSVGPEAAGRGIGSELLARVERWADDVGGGRVALTNSRRRESFRRGFYPRRDYREVDCVVYVKRVGGENE